MRKPVTPSATLQQRYWSYIDRGEPDECWLWTGCTEKGYGKFWVGNGPHYAHRVGWTLAHGESPGDLEVRHTCDNPPCQNPSHLVLGTHADNMRDMAERGRAYAPNFRGEKNNNAKLTEDDVQAIAAMNAGGLSQHKIAKVYGVNQSSVSRILGGKRWSYAHRR